MKRLILFLSFLPLLGVCNAPFRAPTWVTGLMSTTTPPAASSPLPNYTPSQPQALTSSLTPTPLGSSAGQIAFAASDGVYIMNTDGTGRTLLPDSIGLYVRPFAWSPDGAKIAFMCSGGICVKDFDGPLLTCPDLGFGLAWSPNGKRIAFVTVEPYYELHVMNADCQGQARLAKVGGDPVWSPDSQRIAFVSPAHSIYLVNADGTELKRLATMADGAAWSPDGTKIAFASYDDGGIHLINTDGTGRTRIAVKALDEAYLLQPTWSPDGSKIAYAPARLLYTGPRVLDTKLYIMNADGTDQKHLTPIVGRRFAWSPDGRMIAVSTEIKGQSGIYLVQAEGAVRLTQLTNQGENYPACRP